MYIGLSPGSSPVSYTHNWNMFCLLSYTFCDHIYICIKWVWLDWSMVAIVAMVAMVAMVARTGSVYWLEEKGVF